MYFAIRKTKNIATIKQLHKQCFPGEQFYDEKPQNIYWIAYNRRGRPVGFAIASESTSGFLFLARAGVIFTHRGNGIHKRLIDVRIRYARKRGHQCAITYTSRENHASANNLIDCGFRAYEPEWKWVGDKFNYWILPIVPQAA